MRGVGAEGQPLKLEVMPGRGEAGRGSLFALHLLL